MTEEEKTYKQIRVFLAMILLLSLTTVALKEPTIWEHLKQHDVGDNNVSLIFSTDTSTQAASASAFSEVNEPENIWFYAS